MILHRVTLQHPGPIDSSLTDAAGRFRFSVDPDTGAVYLVSARWQRIEYFAPPLDLQSGVPPDVAVMVADTSSIAAVRLAARHLIVSPVTEDGTRNVVDLFVVDNPGPSTRVSRDSLHATWRARLPRYAVNVHGGNSGFSLETLRLEGDTLALYAAIPPGQRDIEIDYQIPPATRRFEVPVDDSVPISNIVSEDKSLRVAGAFARSDTVIDKREYTRWQGRLEPGIPLVLEFGAGPAPRWLVPTMVVAMALALAGATLAAVRSRRV